MNMRSLINEHKLLPSSTESNRGIVNVFTNKKATVEQAHDLLQARDEAIMLRFSPNILFHTSQNSCQLFSIFNPVFSLKNYHQ